jgi:hypothetical protein
MVPYSYAHIQRLEEAGQFPRRVKHLGYARKQPRLSYCQKLVTRVSGGAFD